MKASDIRAALRRHFAPPEQAIVFEVAQATGFDANRRLDAVAMELWPSRGLSLTGIEIKTARNDWRREKKNPRKAEEVARFCDFFYVAAPPALVPREELPSAWGLLEISDGHVSKRVEAVRTEAIAIGRPFMAALLRATQRAVDVDEVDALIAAREKDRERSFQIRVTEEARRVVGAMSESAAAWHSLVKALGRDPGHTWESDSIIRAVSLVLRCGVAETHGGLQLLLAVVGDAKARLDRIAGELGVDAPKTLI